ncbi:MAG: glycine cleavage system protein GcvH [Leptospirales bacterium]|nr:glycine cleavage system protein GcvH [Leptospirales bacterium]
MASKIPENCLYTPKHEWAREEAGLLWIGITDYAQDSLGDIVFLSTPAVGAALSAGISFGSIESVKAAEDLYAPTSGVVAEVNEALRSAPEKINQDAYGSWILKLKDFDRSQLSSLLSPQAYSELLAKSAG